MKKNISHPWSLSLETVLLELNVKSDEGLSENEYKKRLSQFGDNTIEQKKEIGPFEILKRQLKSIIVLLLFIAALISLSLGHYVETSSIFAVLVINTAIGFFTELKAVHSMEALKNLGKMSTKVRRETKVQAIDSEKLVPGDIVYFEAGDIITADVRIINQSNLSIDESPLTGESAPISKQLNPLAQETPLPERTNMLYKGTSITHGSCQGVVCATGMATEIGKIAQLTQESQEEITPLEERLEKLGRKLVILTLLVATLIALSGIIVGKSAYLMLETAIALAVATIPEGLPIVATMALARGMWIMAKRNVLINKLSAVETLGATTVIMTDKTGTLTENKMSASLITLPSGEAEVDWKRLSFNFSEDVKESELKELLEIGVLCNNAFLKSQAHHSSLGDPLEIALLEVAQLQDITRESLESQKKRIKEEAFSPLSRMMAVFVQEKDQLLVAVKGAPEAVIEHCQSNLSEKQKQWWLDQNKKMSDNGLRILALAKKYVSSSDISPYTDLKMTGLVGLFDPPRSDIKDAINKCHRAGVKVVMATGDQAGTALNVGRTIEIVKDNNLIPMTGVDLGEKEGWNDSLKKKILSTFIFARVTPKQKLDLITFLQEQNEVVAMTGDGVNDAPALKKADIGVAMGLRGTQVAKEASDMVLKDDLFSSIISAIFQGRVIFRNIQSFVIYLLSCNISEVFVIAIASILNTPLPILPLQILFLNLVTDVFPALALGMNKGDASFLSERPRLPNSPLISQKQWWLVGWYGVVITSVVLTTFFLSLYYFEIELKKSITLAFSILGISQIFHVFNMRNPQASLLKNDVIKNIYVWAAIIFCLCLIILVVQIPILAKVFQLTPLTIKDWLTVFAISLIPLLVGQIGMASAVVKYDSTVSHQSASRSQ